MSELLSCQMCSYFALHEQQLMRHVCHIHEQDPNFLIYCSTCSRSFTKLDSFRKHKLRSNECSCEGHLTPQSLSQMPVVPNPNDDMPPTDCEENSSFVLAPRRPSTKWRAATFILGIKEKHNLSQAAVDTMLSSTTSLVNGLLHDVLAGLREELPEGGKEVLDKKMQEGSFDLQPFNGLETAYLQNKYFREYFKLVVSKTVCMCHIRCVTLFQACLHWRRNRIAAVVDMAVGSKLNWYKLLIAQVSLFPWERGLTQQPLRCISLICRYKGAFLPKP